MATVGIDLGTTNSLVSVWQDDKCTLIPNNLGEYLTPSVVGIDEDGEMLVGRTAKERLISHPESTVASFKRFMGTEKTFMLGNRRFTAADLSSMVLRQLKEDAEKHLGIARWLGRLHRRGLRPQHRQLLVRIQGRL